MYLPVFLNQLYNRRINYLFLMGTQYDYIFAGGGIAGLTLAYLLCRHHQEVNESKKILILDPKGQAATQSKNICFWADQPVGVPIPLKAVWQNASFGNKQSATNQALGAYTYHCFDSEEYLDHLRDTLTQEMGCVFKEERVIRIKNREVAVEGGMCYQADAYVFDSTPSLENTSPAPPLYQHFVGWEVLFTDQPQIESSSFTLMDFGVSQQQGTAFMYVLPFSEHKVLFEITYMSTRLLSMVAYEEDIRTYLATHFPTSSYQIVKKEQGKIPMWQLSQQADGQQGAIALGTKGGLTKPTTGYTFWKSYQHALHIVACIRAKQPVSPLSTSARFAFYDRLLLHILRHTPSQIPRIMGALFGRNRYERVLRFLDERTSFGQECRIFLTLPWRPFLTALFHEYIAHYVRFEPRNRPKPAPHPTLPSRSSTQMGRMVVE